MIDIVVLSWHKRPPYPEGHSHVTSSPEPVLLHFPPCWQGFGTHCKSEKRLLQ